MMRLILVILLIQSIMISACHSGQEASGDKDNVAGLVLNGKVLDLSAEKTTKVTEYVLTLMIQSEDFYELLVTDNLITSLKSKNEYLEVSFSEALTVTTDKFGAVSFSRIMIPLSGRYAANDQLTFFSGDGDFSNTPLVRKEGLEGLRRLMGD
jgi:hypothetical protein